ncbi:hypothetical protein C2W62_35735 [Candidatus Entotheonella serta]|nr:hypothetical protein C2W62_35735 [Candidatus Entotheonella serta]
MFVCEIEGGGITGTFPLYTGELSILNQGATPVKIEVSVSEIIDLFKEIQIHPEQRFNLISHDIRESIGKCLSKMMEVELAQFLGRECYERTQKPSNHRNDSYDRRFNLKGIGQVRVKIPRDCQGQFQTQVIPHSQQYEDQLKQDLSVMFLTDVSTRMLSLLSTRLIGRKVSPAEVSNANKELIEAVDKVASTRLF